MTQTHHILSRMSQRGFTADMLDLVLTYGRQQQDKTILDRKTIQQIIAQLDHTRKDLLKLMDKGGAAVVSDGETLITTYRR